MRYFIVLVLFIATSSLDSLQAQPCHERKIAKDSLQRITLRDFMVECRKNYFDWWWGPMGIFLLTEYQDTKGSLHWDLSYSLNDSYKHTPTDTYCLWNDHLVLIYTADSTGKVKDIQPTPELIGCLENMITDRVYLQPPATYRWVELIDPASKQKKLYKVTDYGVQTPPVRSLTAHFVFPQK
jgi:hypothetical protein